MAVVPKPAEAKRPSQRRRAGGWLARRRTNRDLPSWLISAVVHLLVLLLLALTWNGVPGGDLASVALIATRGDSPDDDSPLDQQITGNVSDDTSNGQNQSATAATEPSESSGTPGPRSLAEALEGGTPFDPTVVLPTALASLGSGILSGSGGELGSGTGSGGRGTPGLNIGGRGRTSFFGTTGEGYKFVFVCDRSDSMGGPGRNALQVAKLELLRSLNQLEHTHQFGIIFYNEQVFKFNPSGESDRLIFATQQNKALAERFIASMTPDDGTDHEKALVAAIAMQPDVIFFLTDADEPKLYPRQLEKIRRMAAGITINAIEFGTGPQGERDNFLSQLARQNGGQYVYVDITRFSSSAGP